MGAVSRSANRIRSATKRTKIRALPSREGVKGRVVVRRLKARENSRKARGKEVHSSANREQAPGQNSQKK